MNNNDPGTVVDGVGVATASRGPGGGVAGGGASGGTATAAASRLPLIGELLEDVLLAPQCRACGSIDLETYKTIRVDCDSIAWIRYFRCWACFRRTKVVFEKR